MPSVSDSDVLSVFVYGTLQRGHRRVSCWPSIPVRVEPATTRGALYDVGPYPALVLGDDRIAGELWTLAPDDVRQTLTALDRVEGCRFRDDDLYRRHVVICTTESMTQTRAYTYLWRNGDSLPRAARIRPGADGLCRWLPNGIG